VISFSNLNGEGTMPVPDDLDNDHHKLIFTIRQDIAVNQGQANRRQAVSKNFHVYLELYFQGKHDQAVRAYCASKRIETRRSDGSQVDPRNGNSDDPCIYYQEHAATMVNEVCGQMRQRWQRNNNNNTVFIAGHQNMANIQGRRIDGYSYEMSYWYDYGDIYIAFHCYPN
jgi:hypothetical protein